MDALTSGKFDPHKVALILFQTGGGCRASNYISLLRKALAAAGYGYVPVVSLNFAGIEKNPGFTLTIPMLYRMVYGILLGDLLMLLRNQCRPYELCRGDSDRLAAEWTDRLAAELGSGKKVRYRRIKGYYNAITEEFSRIPRRTEAKVRVGIVGEIFVKFSPLGNNNLEEFLLSEGAESVMPGLLDFCLYYICNLMADWQLYRMGSRKKYWIARLA